MAESSASDRDVADKATPGQGQEAPGEVKPAECEALRREANEWRAKADEYLDNYRRTMADFSNYRKRQDRERDQLYQRVSMDVLRKLLPAIDDLHLALKNVPGDSVSSNWAQGVALIAHKLDAILTDFGAVSIEALGKPFDPNFHNALTKEESRQYPAGTVMEELQKGYMMGDQVLRPTGVKVSTGPASE